MQYDNEGNKGYEQKLHETTHSEGYSYDSVYRLIDYQVGTLVGSTITMVITQTAYNLDPLGNWKSKTTDMVTQNRTHSPSNEITKIDTTPILSDYDGNTSDDGTNLYSYDEENRLVKVAAKSNQLQFLDSTSTTRQASECRRSTTSVPRPSTTMTVGGRSRSSRRLA